MLNTSILIICVAAALVGVEILFFAYCFRWLSSGKRLREKQFALLDSERAELLELQASLMHDLKNAKKISEETLSKLNRIGAEAHAEWTDMVERVENVLVEVEGRTHKLLEENLENLHKHRMGLDKSIQDGSQTNARLIETVLGARKLLRLFDKNIPQEEIFKDLQTEKYAQAKQMLSQGVDASTVSKKLSMSQSEVALLSYLK